MTAGGACALSLFALPRTAHAGGFDTAAFGSAHGSAAAPNAYAIFYNPAAMGGMTGTEFQIDGTLAARTMEYTRSSVALSPSNQAYLQNGAYVTANTGTNKLINLVGSPFLGVATDFGTRNFHLGLASYVPYGGQEDWGTVQNSVINRLAPGAVDGSQRWMTITGDVLAIYNTLAAAYRLEKPRLSFGVGLSYVLHEAKFLQARNLDGSDDTFDTRGSLVEGRSLLDVSGSNMAASAGVYWEPLDKHRMRIGLSYLSQPGFGEMRLKGKVTQQFGVMAQQAKPIDVDFLQTYPDQVRFGFAWKMTRRTEFRADAWYVRWSAFKDQCVVQTGGNCSKDATGADPSGKVIAQLPRNWKDTVTAKFGVGYWITPPTEFFANVTYGNGAVPKSTLDTTYFDSDQVGFALGVRQEVTKHFYIAGSYNYLYYMPVNTVSCDSSGNCTGASQLANYTAPSKQPSADGKFSSSIYFFNVNATLAF